MLYDVNDKFYDCNLTDLGSSQRGLYPKEITSTSPFYTYAISIMPNGHFI